MGRVLCAAVLNNEERSWGHTQAKLLGSASLSLRLGNSELSSGNSRRQ